MRIKASILALALIGAPLGLQAVGLGKINVQSGLGQPLRAEVQIAATPEELAGVNARLASPEAFKQAGIEYAASLRGLSMSVERRGEGAVLRITSDRPLNDPFVDLLI
ncbi:MAG: hypothetical protein HGA47_05405, partial [Zoogloea sp.]|nr:hypothetical protein [Zoogloea sp.]